MDTKAKRGRPAKADAKVALSLRLPPDLVAGYQALGSDWRVRMEVALIAGLAPASPQPTPKPRTALAKAPTPKVEAAPKPAFKSRLKGEWKAP